MIAGWMAPSHLHPGRLRGASTAWCKRELEWAKTRPSAVWARRRRPRLGTHSAGRGPSSATRHRWRALKLRRPWSPTHAADVCSAEHGVVRGRRRRTRGRDRRVCKAGGGFHAGAHARLTLPDVQPIEGVRRVTIRRQRGHRGPPGHQLSQRAAVPQDLYALDVLSYVLTQGQSSRLVEKDSAPQRLVTAISSNSWTPALGQRRVPRSHSPPRPQRRTRPRPPSSTNSRRSPGRRQRRGTDPGQAPEGRRPGAFEQTARSRRRRCWPADT